MTTITAEHRPVTRPRSVDPETRTVRATLSTGAPVRRFGRHPDGTGYGHYEERLSLTPASIARLQRAPVLKDHDATNGASVLGVVERAELRGNSIEAVLRFGSSPLADEYFADVADGLRANISIGYGVIAATRSGDRSGIPIFDVEPQLLECSLVAIGADHTAHIRSESPIDLHRMDMTMSLVDHPLEPPVEPAADNALSNNRFINNTLAADPVAEARAEEKARSAAIILSCRKLNLPIEHAADLISRSIPLDEARTALIDINHQRHAASAVSSVHIAAGDDYSAPAGIAEAISSAWADRCNPAVKLDGRAQQYRGMRTAEALRHLLAAHHIRPGVSERDVVKRAATTSDFPNILASSLNKALMPTYLAARSGLVELARKDSVRDFKTATRLRSGEFPSLQLVAEHAEYTYGSIDENKESFVLKKYGRVFAISWEALVNDDLDALSAASRSGGLAAANLEADLLAERVNSNPVMSDGVQVYHATHGNVGTPGVISVTSVGELTGLMRKQKGLDAATILNIKPRYLVVPSGLETIARQLVATIAPATTATDNSAFRALTVVVDPRLDAGDANGWFLFADPGTAPSLSIAFLEGEEGPVTESRNGFHIDAVEVKVRHVAAAYWADHRGAASNAGA